MIPKPLLIKLIVGKLVIIAVVAWIVYRQLYAG